MIAYLLVNSMHIVLPANAATPSGPMSDPSISMSNSAKNSGVSISITPGTNNIDTASDTVGVNTTIVSGYQLSLSTDSTDNSLRHTRSSNLIPTIGQQFPSTSALGDNTWGFSLDNVNYSAVPDSGSPVIIKSTSGPTTATDNTTVTYGAKATLRKPAGQYKSTVVYTAVGRPVAAPILASLSPSTGPAAGGTTITISGTNLNTTTKVFFDFNGNGQFDSGEECGNVQIADPVSASTSVTCATPASGLGGDGTGSTNVVVTAQGGETTLNNGFTYISSQAFQFTIDTRMTDTVDNNASHLGGSATSFNIPTSNNHGFNWIINWGDGCQETHSGSGASNSAGITHNYALTNCGASPSGANGSGAGEYQITIRPSGATAMGWMKAFGFDTNSDGANIQTNKNMLKSIDTPFSNEMKGYDFRNTFYGARNAVAIPSGLFANINTASVTDLSGMFQGTFAYFAYNSTSAVIPAGLFANLNTTSATTFENMFSNTFYYAAFNSAGATIPAGLFDSINTSSLSNQGSLRGMFMATFSYYARYSQSTIPAGLFNHITIPASFNGLIDSMFNSTFAGYSRNSVNGVIPAGLFDSITVPATYSGSLEKMFYYTFYYFGYNSVGAVIPTGLFDSINTASATSLREMFMRTFSCHGFHSTVGQIPAGLFSHINTASVSAVDGFVGMFNYTFHYFAYSAPGSYIPAGLFNTIIIKPVNQDLSLDSLFTGTFMYYGAYSTASTIPAGLFGGIDLAGCRSCNLSSLFNNTFYWHANPSTVANIPPGLFDGINTKHAQSVILNLTFKDTFYGFGDANTAKHIPDNLFANLFTTHTPNDPSAVDGMFYRTFYAWRGTGNINKIFGVGKVFDGPAVTAASLGGDGTNFGMMSLTFFNTGITGDVVAFVNTAFPGLTPTNQSSTFWEAINLTNYYSLPNNWR
ncbi:MAG: IPT/TIG domain-containing protein [Candidatus Nomurabacteria bacterium]|nr:IPT/TIG domain-containing protein [Candidatus Nomurabacteria bacterium]